MPDFFSDDLAASQDGDVFQHGLATVAEAGALTATTFRMPRMVFTTKVGQGFAILLQR